MVTFKVEMERFERKGEKTGWTYIAIPPVIAHQIKPDCRKSFRVKRLTMIVMAMDRQLTIGEMMKLGKEL